MKKTALHFAGRRHSAKGITSTVIGGIAWLIFLALCISSSVHGGDAPLLVGTIGVLDTVFALAGIILAWLGFQERDVYYAFPIAGMSVNGILFIVYFSLYFMGVAIM